VPVPPVSALPSSYRRLLARRLHDVQLARARLAPLPLGELSVLLPAEAARVCELERVTLELEGVDPEETVPALSPDAVTAPLVHLDRAIGVLRGEARPGRDLDELDRELLWTFATATAPLLHVATLAAIARAPHRDTTVLEHRRGPRRPR
jgi:hypothetical protein